MVEFSDVVVFFAFLIVSYFLWDMIGNRDSPNRKPEPWVRKIKY